MESIGDSWAPLFFSGASIAVTNRTASYQVNETGLKLLKGSHSWVGKLLPIQTPSAVVNFVELRGGIGVSAFLCFFVVFHSMVCSCIHYVVFETVNSLLKLSDKWILLVPSVAQTGIG